MIPSKSLKAFSNCCKEDEGWILVLIWDGKRRGTDLCILNSENLDLQAKINLPISIPHGLHGSWAPEF